VNCPNLSVRGQVCVRPHYARNKGSHYDRMPLQVAGVGTCGCADGNLCLDLALAAWLCSVCKTQLTVYVCVYAHIFLQSTHIKHIQHTRWSQRNVNILVCFILVLFFLWGGKKHQHHHQHYNLVPVAHTCNPSYLGVWNWDDCGLRSTSAKSSQDPISINSQV
jgi:hypothetical protein